MQWLVVVLFATEHGTIAVGHSPKYGKLKWASLIKPIAQLAEEGFYHQPTFLATLIENDQERLSRFATAKAYFFNADGSPKTAGTRLEPRVRGNVNHYF